MHGSFTDNLSYMRDSTQKIFLFTTRDLSLLVEIHLPNRIVQSTDTPVEFEIHLLNRIVLSAESSVKFEIQLPNRIV